MLSLCYKYAMHLLSMCYQYAVHINNVALPIRYQFAIRMLLQLNQCAIAYIKTTCQILSISGANAGIMLSICWAPHRVLNINIWIYYQQTIIIVSISWQYAIALPSMRYQCVLNMLSNSTYESAISALQICKQYVNEPFSQCYILSMCYQWAAIFELSISTFDWYNIPRSPCYIVVLLICSEYAITMLSLCYQHLSPLSYYLSCSTWNCFLCLAWSCFAWNSVGLPGS